MRTSTNLSVASPKPVLHTAATVEPRHRPLDAFGPFGPERPRADPLSLPITNRSTYDSPYRTWFAAGAFCAAIGGLGVLLRHRAVGAISAQLGAAAGGYGWKLKRAQDPATLLARFFPNEVRGPAADALRYVRVNQRQTVLQALAHLAPRNAELRGAELARLILLLTASTP